MMTATLRWRKAVATSLFFHLFFLTISGFLAVRLFTAPAVIEQYIELDLTPGLQTENSGSSVSTPPTPRESMPQPITPAPVIRAENPTPVVSSADSMSILEAEVPAEVAGTQTSNASTQPVEGNAGTSGSSGKRGGIAPPSILSKTEPAYPSAARQASMQGTVLLKIQILENGRPGSISVFRSSGHELLDDAAIAAVQQWRFIPAKDHTSGRTVICYSTLPVSFRLR